MILIPHACGDISNPVEVALLNPPVHEVGICPVVVPSFAKNDETVVEDATVGRDAGVVFFGEMIAVTGVEPIDAINESAGETLPESCRSAKVPVVTFN